LVDSKKKVKKLKQKLLSAGHSKKIDDVDASKIHNSTKEETKNNQTDELVRDIISQIELEAINIETIVTDRAIIERQENPEKTEQETSQLEDITASTTHSEDKTTEVDSSYLGTNKQKDYHAYKLLGEWDPTEYPHIDPPREETTNQPEFKSPSSKEKENTYVQPKY
jgi:hypothetical protein